MRTPTGRATALPFPAVLLEKDCVRSEHVVSLIYKIVARPLWSEAEASKVFKGAPVDLADGFIHFSTAAQVAETATKYFRGQGDLVLLAVEPSLLGEALRWEPSRGGALFPHLYAVLAVDHVAWAKPLPLGEDGHHDFTGLLP